MLSLPTERLCSIPDSEVPDWLGFAAVSFCGAAAFPVLLAGVFSFPAEFSTGAAGGCPALAGGVEPVFFAGLALPRVEKFHLPERSRRRLTCGCASVRSVMCSVFEKI